MINNEINESEFFEENDLYVKGKVLQRSIIKIDIKFNMFDNMFKDVASDVKESIINDIDISDIKINNLEEEIETIIERTSNDIMHSKKKNIFVLESTPTMSDNEVIGSKKGNYLRNEAKILEETIKQISLPTYQQIKTNKFKHCDLNSYHFFKSFCKKEVGKENNYIFNYRDNYLNDMTKIDQLFFQDFFQPHPIPSPLINELIYEFSIYHPTKNIKTQQIAVIGRGNLLNLKDKIYCVLDEIYTEQQQAFFFIENCFYNFIPPNHNELPLSHSISENRLRKLTLKDLEYKDKCIGDTSTYVTKSKFEYNKELYCGEYTPRKLYDNYNMNDVALMEIPIRIGYPYLFRHGDGCDHMVVLNDVRVIDKYDSFKVEQSGNVSNDNCAVVTYQKKLKRRKCDACLFYYAKFISINDISMGDVSHALFLCDYCIKKLHYKDVSEKNTGNLKLVPYFHD